MPVELDTWQHFVGVVTLVALSPGPSTLLVTAQRMRAGLPAAVSTIAGDLSANLVQIGVASLSLAVLSSVSGFLSALEWVSVGLLGWLSARRLCERSPGPAVDALSPCACPLRIFWKGFLISAANPKAIVFFTGLFPAFLDTVRPLPGQLAVLAGTFLAIDGLCLLAYATAGRSLERWLRRRHSDLPVERVGAIFLLAACLLLATRALSGIRS